MSNDKTIRPRILADAVGLDTLVYNFAQKGLHAATISHLMHFATPSFAEHLALNEFYEGIVDHVDNLVETYQGAVGHVLPYQVMDLQDMAEYATSPTDLITHIRDSASALEKAMPITNIGNILQDVQAFCNQKIYKLSLE